MSLGGVFQLAKIPLMYAVAEVNETHVLDDPMSLTLDLQSMCVLYVLKSDFIMLFKIEVT